MKQYIRAAGLRVKCYQTLFKNCRSDSAKVKCLRQFLQDNGIDGRPSLEKCTKLRKKNENLKDVQELDTSNIISESK